MCLLLKKRKKKKPNHKTSGDMGEASVFHLPALRWGITIKGKERVSIRQYGYSLVQKK